MTALGDALGASVEIPVRNEPTAVDLAERRRKTIESGARCAPFPDRDGWPPMPDYPHGPAAWSDEPEDLIDDRFGPDPSDLTCDTRSLPPMTAEVIFELEAFYGPHGNRAYMGELGPFGPACDRCAPDPCECPPCPECGEPILSDDPDLTHTPGTERVHAQCCTDCNGEPE